MTEFLVKGRVLRRGLLLLILSTSGAPVSASVTLTNGDPVALREAVQQGGAIRLDFNGIVKLVGTAVIEADTTVDAVGHSVVLDADSKMRHFVVTNGATLRLTKVTLANGYFRGRDGQIGAPRGETGQGGSIFNTGGTLQLVSCRFLNNQVRAGDGANLENGPHAGGEAFGGAIFSLDGVVSAANCVFAGNQCTGGHGSPGPGFTYGAGGDAYGGAMYLTNSRISLDAVVLTNNIAQGGEISRNKLGFGGGSALGGALAVELSSGTLSNSITRCFFAENRAYAATRAGFDTTTRSFADGGALFCGSGSLSIEQTLFSQNVALGGPGYDYTRNPDYGDGRGGAVFNRDGELTIQDSAIVFNQGKGGSLPESWSVFNAGEAGSAWGGAIYNHGTLTVRNSTLGENVASGGASYAFARPSSSYGGAVFNEGSISLLNVTVGRNYANPGGVGRLEYPSGARGDALATVSGTVALTNTILFSVQGRTNVWGTVNDGGHNICSDASAAFTAASSRNNTDPLLGPVGNHGGPTPTIPLLPASPAIDAGDDSAAPSTDQRGVTRPKGLTSDIGAFELAPTLRLVGGGEGRAKVEYLFKANEANEVSASTNLVNWSILGSRVADTNGVTAIEEVGLDPFSIRFYRAEPQPVR